MVFSVEGGWKWGEHELPKVSRFTYWYVACDGAWYIQLQSVFDNGRKKVNRLHSIIGDRDINLNARRLLPLSSTEYGSEVWECNKGPANALESYCIGGSQKNIIFLGALLKSVLEGTQDLLES